MKRIIDWLKDNFWYMVSYLIFMGCFFVAMAYVAKEYQPKELKDYKDGVQNHLVWSIKGECFFVRPHTETTVYLVRVVDCDRK
jgi:hypothetical protein